MEFPSVVDAVRCAAELQRAMIDREAGMPEERRISLSVGSVTRRCTAVEGG